MNISVIVCSRVEGNPNHNLKRLVESLAANTIWGHKIEVLVKFDEDDGGSPHCLKGLQPTPFQVKHLYGPRNRGYIDIHGGYNLLLPMIDPSSKMVIAMADDFTVDRGWDAILMAMSQGCGPMFIIHQLPHPDQKQVSPTEVKFFRPNAHEPGNQFCMEWDVDGIADLHIIDGMPAWSLSLLKACIDFPISFTDAWTLLLEHQLWNHYRVNIARFSPSQVVHRELCANDQQDAGRWATERRENFEYMKTANFKAVIAQQAIRVWSRTETK